MSISKLGSRGSKYLNGQGTDRFNDATIYDIWLNTNTIDGTRYKRVNIANNSINHWMTMNRLSWLIMLFCWIPVEYILQWLDLIGLSALGTLLGLVFIFDMMYVFYSKYKLKRASIGNYMLIDNTIYIWKIYDVKQSKELTAFEIFKMLEKNNDTLVNYIVGRLANREFNRVTSDEKYKGTYFYLDELEAKNNTVAGYNTVNKNDAIMYTIPWTCRTKVQINRIDLEAWDHRIDYSRMYTKNETYGGFVDTFRNVGFMG